ncbi:L-lactate dehydrogenase (cytochrome) [Kaistia hirudinis]|uniref:L-lactate dehydrogenase (Cytochrome) n=1 Tax=Kaistia hirudinis TaxID=1293440 RepID=A0A840ALF5_9HYPH|nr:L-lactate dehydrogenase (cytochrome) [Kaistia hirudinis]
MSLKTVTSIDDLRILHKRRVPRAFFDYCDRGSYAEETLDANRADLKALKLRQRVMVDVSNRSTETTILGEKAAYPFALAPTGLTGMQHADGEILAARAAEKAGIPFCLSTMSICSIEDVAAGTTKPFWFQLYVMKDRGFAKSLVERAIAAKCSALVLTLDLQVQGQRHRDIKNGMTVPPRVTLANLIDVATKPDWAFKVLRSPRKTFGNLDGHVKGMSGVKSLGQWISGQFDPALNWDDVAWIRSIWPGKLVLKGVLDVGDARKAAATGAEAIVVSNHGGRQLDGAPSAISTLPRIVDAVGDRTEIIFDSGVRSGQDVLRALALGAKSCLIGRAFLYGLGAAGEAGVSKAIEIIGKEFDVSMALTGRRNVGEIDETVIDRG